MPSGLIALLDDVAMIAKLASASVDDIAAATAKAGTKAAGVVIDDTAVTPRYVTGLTPERELPIIWKIALGSLRNKLLFLLPGSGRTVGLPALADHADPDDRRRLSGVRSDREDPREDPARSSARGRTDRRRIRPKELEDRQVAGAIRTDLILSAEIMAIALNELSELRIAEQAAALAMVGIAITVAVYGVVGADREARRYRPAPGRAPRPGVQGAGHGPGPCRPQAAHRPVGASAPRRCCGSAAESCFTGWRSLARRRSRTSSMIWHMPLARRPVRLGRSWNGWPMRLAHRSSARSSAGFIAMIVRRFHKHPEELIVD